MTHPYEPPFRNKEPAMIDLTNPNCTPWRDCTPEWQAEVLRQEAAGAVVEALGIISCDWKYTSATPDERDVQAYRILKPVLPPQVPAPAPWHPETNSIMWGELTPDQQAQLRAAKGGMLFCTMDGDWMEVNEGTHRFPGRAYRAKPAPKPNLIDRLRNHQIALLLPAEKAALAADELIRSTNNATLIAKWDEVVK